MAEKEKDSTDEFVRLLSHQMKAPVHAIQSLLGAITDGYGEEISPAVQEALERALARAREAGQLVDDLLEYESSERGAAGEEREFELVDLLAELTFRFSLGAATKDVAVEVSLPQDQEVHITGSRTAVEHAIRNLIDNAVKYTPPLGRVEVSLGLDTATHSARIAIRDSGDGIPPEEMEELFKPFFRSKTRVAKTGGTGLGLAIAQRILVAHRGTIEVSSEAGVGTTFTVAVPYARVERSARKPDRRRRVVIIGGVTSGPKVAARLRRLDEELDITIIERNEFLIYTGCQLPYFISNTMGSSSDVSSVAYRSIRTAHFFDTMKNITVMNMTTAEKIDRSKRTVIVRHAKDEKALEIPYDLLVLATGSHPAIPPIPGTKTGLVFPLHSLEDAKLIKERLSSFNAQDVVIIGGGLIGFSTIQALLEIGARVTVLERESTILGAYFDADFSRRIGNAIKHKGIKIATGDEVVSISSSGTEVTAHTKNGHHFNADLILLGSGTRPNSDLARACDLELGPEGGILVDEHLRTSDSSIFAVGDCAETSHLLTGQHEYWPLGSVSVKMGRTAADVIGGKNSTFHGSLGTVLLSCAELRLARTGLTTERAKQAGFDPESFVLTGSDRPGYAVHPGELCLKVIADRASRKVIGAQAYGRGEVAPKISLCAAAIANRMTTDQIFGLDLGHSPESNHPIDVVQSACLMLNNKLDGLVHTISAEEIESAKDRITLVAVVTAHEATRSFIPGSLEVNAESLRKTDLPFRRDEEVALYSRNSMEAYLAYRYLVQHGYDKVKVLEGGYLFFV